MYYRLPSSLVAHRVNAVFWALDAAGHVLGVCIFLHRIETPHDDVAGALSVGGIIRIDLSLLLAPLPPSIGGEGGANEHSLFHPTAGLLSISFIHSLHPGFCPLVSLCSAGLSL